MTGLIPLFQIKNLRKEQRPKYEVKWTELVYYCVHITACSLRAQIFLWEELAIKASIRTDSTIIKFYTLTVPLTIPFPVMIFPGWPGRAGTLQATASVVKQDQKYILKMHVKYKMNCAPWCSNRKHFLGRLGGCPSDTKPPYITAGHQACFATGHPQWRI